MIEKMANNAWIPSDLSQIKQDDVFRTVDGGQEGAPFRAVTYAYRDSQRPGRWSVKSALYLLQDEACRVRKGLRDGEAAPQPLA
ncbi:hypothetical protein [Burkholderia vietnamiensis]|uniref:hypothetical protein n=1 Tax=Burkholderia vietnamiensis TaxID=60552 RepID=UPI0012DB5BC3|nr:hypothetical protein [Burkholderia vietnamiensis]